MLKLKLVVALAALSTAQDCSTPPGTGPMGGGSGGEPTPPIGGTAGTTGGGGTGGGTDGATVLSYAADIEPILDKKCTFGCHMPEGLGGPGPNEMTYGASLDLTVGMGYTELQAPSVLVDMPILGETAEISFLWHKINDTQASVPAKADSWLADNPMVPPQGTKMPQLELPGAGPLTEDDRMKIRQWIESGANP